MCHFDEKFVLFSLDRTVEKKLEKILDLNMHFEYDTIWTIAVDLNLNLKNSNKNHNFVSLNENEMFPKFKTRKHSPYRLFFRENTVNF